MFIDHKLAYLVSSLECIWRYKSRDFRPKINAEKGSSIYDRIILGMSVIRIADKEAFKAKNCVSINAILTASNRKYEIARNRKYESDFHYLGASIILIQD